MAGRNAAMRPWINRWCSKGGAAEHRDAAPLRREHVLFHRAGRFPAAEGIELPLSREAVYFYKSGQPFLRHNLPFWMASLVGRLLVLLIPIVAMLTLSCAFCLLRMPG
jgi:hypothetical protein